MKFIYVAKHGSGGNNDEDAIAHCLKQEGHEVVCIQERQGRLCTKYDGDVLLFHKWYDPQLLARSKRQGLKVFWYFDLVDHPDPSLKERCETRCNWMRAITPLVDVGFCTDGDWVDRDRTGKLIRLTQGTDGRTVGHVPPPNGVQDIDVLFTGTQRGGRDRYSFVALLKARLGDRLHHVESGVHGRQLAELVGRSKIVLAPDAPVTERYWSNRVYVMLGFGAFLLHPHIKQGKFGYVDGHDLVMYGSRMELISLINEYLDNSKADARTKIAGQGFYTTCKMHLYKHRVRTLCTILEEKLKWLPNRS